MMSLTTRTIFVRIFIVIVVKLIVKFITKRHRCHCRWFSDLLRNTYISKFQLQLILHNGHFILSPGYCDSVNGLGHFVDVSPSNSVLHLI